MKATDWARVKIAVASAPPRKRKPSAHQLRRATLEGLDGPRGTGKALESLGTLVRGDEWGTGDGAYLRPTALPAWGNRGRGGCAHGGRTHDGAHTAMCTHGGGVSTRLLWNRRGHSTGAARVV